MLATLLSFLVAASSAQENTGWEADVVPSVATAERRTPDVSFDLRGPLAPREQVSLVWGSLTSIGRTPPDLLRSARAPGEAVGVPRVVERILADDERVGVPRTDPGGLMRLSCRDAGFRGEIISGGRVWHLAGTEREAVAVWEIDDQDVDGEVEHASRDEAEGLEAMASGRR